MADLQGFDASNVDKVEFQCIYLITKDKGPFKKDQAIMVIDSGRLYKEEYDLRMGFMGFETFFLDGNIKNTAAVSTLSGSRYPFRSRK